MIEGQLKAGSVLIPEFLDGPRFRLGGTVLDFQFNQKVDHFDLINKDRIGMTADSNGLVVAHKMNINLLQSDFVEICKAMINGKVYRTLLIIDHLMIVE